MHHALPVAHPGLSLLEEVQVSQAVVVVYMSVHPVRGILVLP
jgi:hypothetical protein